MKKICALIFAILLSVAWNGCKKLEQVRYKKVILLPNTGQKIVAMEDYIKNHRDALNPNAYDSLAEYCVNEVMIVLKDEPKPDVGVESKSGEIARLVGIVIDEQWDHPKKSDSKLLKHIRLGVQDDVYRTFTRFSEAELGDLKGYIKWWIIGSETQGVRDEAEEQKLKNKVDEVDPKNQWEMTYKQELQAYFKSYAQDPKNKAKPKRQGFLNWGWFD